MARSFPRFCSQCGSPLEAGHRFCTNCGATTSVESNNPTALAADDQATQASISAQGSSSVTSAATIPTENAKPPDAAKMAAHPDDPGSTLVAQLSTPNTPASGATPPVQGPNISGPMYSSTPTFDDQFYAQPTDVHSIPPPPPPESFVSTPQQAPASSYNTHTTPDYAAVPAYARAPKRSRGGLVAIVLLLVIVLGGGGVYYAFFRPHGASTSNQNNNGTNTQGTTGKTPVSNNGTPGSGNTPGSTVGTTTSSGPTPEQVNLQFTYAGIEMTITSVQEKQSFPDDNSATSNTVRINMNEKNPTTSGGGFLYSDVARLLLPDGTTANFENSQNSTGPGASTSRTNWIDFSVPASNLDLSKLVLRMGTANESQMDIPLMPGADLSKYQPKTITPNTAFQYAGLSWTITKVTESLSAADKQAATGQVYIVVTLGAVNSTGSDFSAYPGDYLRLKSGDTTSSPTDFTFPVSVASQSNGSGTVTFSMPQGNTSFTLMMLTRPASPPINAASATFQIQ
jgi:hypothetical protein